MSDMKQWIDEPEEEDFHPAKPGDNPIWLGGMKYVPADLYKAERAENARLREAMNSAIDSLRRSPDQNTETIRTMTHLFLALETKGNE